MNRASCTHFVEHSGSAALGPTNPSLAIGSCAKLSQPRRAAPLGCWPAEDPAECQELHHYEQWSDQLIVELRSQLECEQDLEELETLRLKLTDLVGGISKESYKRLWL